MVFKAVSWSLASAVLVLGCSSGKNFSSGGPKAETGAKGDPAAVTTDEKDTGSGSSDKDPTPGSEDALGDKVPPTKPGEIEGEIRSEDQEPGQAAMDFRYGPQTALVDFLIVFDNSISMNPHLPRVAQGFESLAAAQWPANTRLGVMTTMPGDPDDLKEIHPEVKGYDGIEKEPGFLNLISAQALKDFAMVADASLVSKAYPQPFCSKSWFAPTEKNSKNASCLRASFQSAFHGVGAEAGLTAAKQLATKRASLFRSRAHVHVVFISDTQDPGKPSESLVAIRPTYAQLKETFQKNSTISGLKLHGVVPGASCKAGEGYHRIEQSYQTAIKESGGAWLDFCDSSGQARTDFAPVAQQIVDALYPEPVFVLASPAKSLVSVTMGKTPIPLNQVRLSADGTRVVLPALKPAAEVGISVVYVER
jgi:hypothetical protein